MSKNLNGFKHFISLGANCYVTEDLIRFGLRNYSYPFDWLFSSDFSGIISLIENDFSGFLSYDVLFQHEDSKIRYYNNIYKFSFFHDFNKYESLKSQLPFVQKKYSRRIKRFRKDICMPTVFFRYIVSKNDIDYVVNNHKKIDEFVKSFCPSNHIIYITHYRELLSLPIEIYYVDKDAGDWITRTPLSKNPVLNDMLRNVPYETKEANKAFKRKRRKRFSLERCFRRLFKKEYVHFNIHRR